MALPDDFPKKALWTFRSTHTPSLEEHDDEEEYCTQTLHGELWGGKTLMSRGSRARTGALRAGKTQKSFARMTTMRKKWKI